MTVKSRSTRNFRIELTDNMGNTYYLTRTNGRVQLVSGNMTPHAIANVAGNNAAMLSFALSDAFDGREAMTAVRKFAQYVKTSKLL
jgi:hypothetical protein